MLSTVTPFKVTLGDFGFFHRSKGSTVFLRPSADPAAWNALYKALAGLYPDCVEREAFTPHLTVGQWGGNKRQLEAECELLGEGWTSVSFDLTHVCPIARDGFDDPFRVIERIPLGTQ